MEQIIYLDPTDDLPMIRDRLDWAESKRVLLVLPKGHRSLRNAVGLRLLIRHAAAREMEIALVTRDRAIVELAREQGIVVYGSVERGQRRRKLTKADTDVLPQQGGARAARVRQRTPVPILRRSGLGRWSQMGVVIILVSVVGLLLLGVALLVMPSAEILVVLPGVEVSQSTIIQADVSVTQMEVITSTIPARDVRVQVKGDVSVNVTTERDVPDAKAQGEVVFTNRTDSEVVVPSGVVVLTTTGLTVRFQTLETTTVPAGIGASAVAPIEALEPGLGGNVRAFLINRIESVEAVQITAVNERATSGGTVKKVPVVSNEDKARARALVLQRLQQEAYLRLREALNEQEFVPPETMVAIPISEVFDHFTDEPADELRLDMIVVVRALAVSGTDANALALYALEKEVPFGMALMPRTLIFQPGEVKNAQDGRVTFEMSASGIAAPIVDHAGLIDAVRGKPIAWAQDYLQEQLSLESAPEIRLQNAWLGRLPLLSMRIKMRSLMPGETP